MSEGPMLTGAVSKISTQAAGGWKIALDVPESMGEVVKQLLGTENNTLYHISFDYAGNMDQPEKRGPGRPRQEGA